MYQQLHLSAHRLCMKKGPTYIAFKDLLTVPSFLPTTINLFYLYGALYLFNSSEWFLLPSLSIRPLMGEDVNPDDFRQKAFFLLLLHFPPHVSFFSLNTLLLSHEQQCLLRRHRLSRRQSLHRPLSFLLSISSPKFCH